MGKTGFVIALAMACAATTPASATDATLTWKDLDLTTEAGKAELDRRIAAAAQQVCTPEAVTGTRIVRRSVSASCLAEARSTIAAQVAARIEHSQAATRQAQTRATTVDARH